MKIKKVVLTTVYPGVESFLNDFTSSLLKQTDLDFKLYVANDGLQKPLGFLKHLPFPIKIINVTGKVASIRKQLILEAILEQPDILIFADADDVMEKNRVEVAQKFLMHNQIVVNELLLFDGCKVNQKGVLGAGLKESQALSFSDIESGNFLGLSNTAIRLEAIDVKELKEIPDDLIAFDWAFFFGLLYRGVKACFTAETATLYRQYPGNVASIQSTEKLNIRRAIEVKCQHYRYLFESKNIYREKSEIFDDLLRKSKKTEFLDRYCESMVRKKGDHEIWWEVAKENL